MPTHTKPTHTRHILQNISLILLSILFLPLDTVILLGALLCRKFIFFRAPNLAGIKKETKTVLVTSSVMTKGLLVCRAFASQGHRVIGVDIVRNGASNNKEWIYGREGQTRFLFSIGRLLVQMIGGILRKLQVLPPWITSQHLWADGFSPGRFSSALSAYYLLPPLPTVDLSDPEEKNLMLFQEFINELRGIILKEKVDFCICISGMGNTIEEAFAAEVLRNELPQCNFLIMNPSTAARLHHKDTFMKLTSELGFNTPVTYYVESKDQILDILFPKEREKFLKGKFTIEPVTKIPPGTERFPRNYILKCISFDELSRGDLTIYPRPGPMENSEREIFQLDISLEKPWILQEYVQGEEYCSHAVVTNGKVRDFIACKSSDLLMHYEHISPDTVEFRKMFGFTKAYAKELDSGNFGGHLSFDFIIREMFINSEVDVQIYPIECNPRAHTASVLRTSFAKEMTQAFLCAPGDPEVSLSELKKRYDMHREGKKPMGYYWIGHDFVTLGLIPFFKFVMNSSEKTAWEEMKKCMKEFGIHLFCWKDAVFDIYDPVPWWCLYHIFWPVAFVESLVKGKKWSRVNVSTARLWECL